MKPLVTSNKSLNKPLVSIKNIYMGRFRITQDFLAVNVTKIPDVAGL